MVGVGGRSKACDNCKSRRVKCDLRKPQCGRCVTARLQCGGPRGFTFIRFDGHGQYAQPEDRDSAGCSAVAVGTRTPETAIRSHPKIRRALPPSRDDVFTAFTLSNLLPVQSLLALNPGVITIKSLSALATSYFGIKHQNTAITQYGFRRYSDALRVVHSALEVSASPPSFDLLEAVMIMALTEFLISDRVDGWVNHARGLERLFELRGPEAMASPPCLEVLDRTRASLIFAAIILRKPTIMSENKWKHIPWSLHPEQIDSLKLLFDIVADYPQLFILRDKLSSVADEDTRTAGARSLSQQCHEAIAKLENWRETFASDPFHTPYETPACQPIPLIEDEDGALHPAWSTTFRYRSLYHANAITVYNAATIMALRFADSIDAEWVSSSDWYIRQEQISTAALTICRSVEYHQLEDWGEQGPFELLFPLRMAHDGISEKEPTIASWITSVMQDISAGRRGLWRSAKSILDVGK